ncbi:Holliday junction resolvase RecU [Mycoplasmopsis felis]|uniref:Holliday junction resolvase RecU n=1 Tax=Mycoplasmopsis felis TaxID=33923 RepID=UPI002AFDEF63|nr:Holliday junction resolvase RecU [Mycoplasmopsis felis]WQQ03741.1 Holliday junction resolvase RecU [Mycoplasmopsis felis]
MKNKGMFLEAVINKTINYFWQNNIALIQKKGLDLKINKIQKINNKLVVNDSNIYKKSTVDYIGCYNGSFICFEAKSCNEDRFDLSNLKEHQLEYLNLIHNNKGISFVILFFSHINRFFKVNINYLNTLFKNKIKSLHINDLIKNSKELFLEFPCILNFLD